MRPHFKALAITGSILVASLGTAVSAAVATTAAPVMDTSVFACGNGVCEVGPGSITVTGSLGGTATIPVTVNTKYS